MKSLGEKNIHFFRLSINHTVLIRIEENSEFFGSRLLLTVDFLSGHGAGAGAEFTAEFCIYFRLFIDKNI